MAHRSPPGFPAAAYALVTNQSRQVLIVQPPGTGGAPWRLPGGLVEPGETPREALRRELAEELGLDRQADTLLAVEWVLPRAPDRRARVVFLFSTLPVTTAEAAGLTLQRDEVAACRWVFIPLPFPRIRVPAMQLASFNDVDLNIPARDPIPPDPNSGHRMLSPTEEKRFRTWMNSLPAEGFAGGGGPSNPDNAYQLRISGYPERKVPLPEHAPGISKKGLLVDGLRPSDGYAVEAKHVRDPDKCNTSRSLDAVNKTLARPPKIDAKGNMKWDPHLDSMYPKDEKSLRRYQAAMEDPRNKEIRGLEIVTNSKGSAAYWQSLMGMTGVKGDARYVP